MQTPNVTYRLWVPPEPHCLADLTGYLIDMEAAKSCFKHLESMADGKDYVLVIHDALLTAAIIYYCRCFTSGIRNKLDINTLSSANADDTQMHDRIIGIRNWHVAHAINQQEIHAVHLIVNANSQAEHLVLGISSYQATSKSLGVADISPMLSLVEKWTKLLREKIVEENLRLRPYVDKLSREQVLALPEKNPEANPNIHARRKQGYYK